MDKRQFYEKFGKRTSELVKLLKLHTDPSTTAEQKEQLAEQLKAEFDLTFGEISQATAESDKADGKLPD